MHHNYKEEIVPQGKKDHGGKLFWRDDEWCFVVFHDRATKFEEHSLVWKSLGFAFCFGGYVCVLNMCDRDSRFHGGGFGVRN